MFKKVFAATLAGLFITAPAFANIEEYGAAKEAYESSTGFKGVKMSGSFFIKGNYRQKLDDTDDYRYYESDFEVKTDFVVDEKTSATLVVEAFDANWVDSELAGDDKNYDQVQKDTQNHLQVTKAVMNHTFSSNTAFSGGVAQNGNGWGTLFGDTLDYAYFLQAKQDVPFGTLTFKTEKIDEGAITNDDKDVDAYLVGFDTKVAGFDVKPAFYMVKDQDKVDGGNEELSKVLVSASGKVAAFDVNAEVNFVDYDGADASVFGVWVDAATTVADLGVNFALGYGSADDATAFDYGDELCPMEILGDDIELKGATFLKAGVSKSFTDKVSADAALAYAMTNVDESDRTAAQTAFDAVYEFNVNTKYKASDAVTLSTGVAYLDGDDAAEKAFKSARIDAYAKVAVAF